MLASGDNFCDRSSLGANLHQFVRDRTWGHHASCTCKIGADEIRWRYSTRVPRAPSQDLQVVDAPGAAYPRSVDCVLDLHDQREGSSVVGAELK